MIKICEDLRQFRESKGLSQSQFADVLGMSVRTLQEYDLSSRKPSDTAVAYFKLIMDEPVVFDLLMRRYDKTKHLKTEIALDKKEIKKRKSKQDPDAYHNLAMYIMDGGKNGTVE